MTFTFTLGDEPHTLWSPEAARLLVGKQVLVGPFNAEDGGHVGTVLSAEPLGVGEGCRVVLDLPALTWEPDERWLSVGMFNPVIL